MLFYKVKTKAKDLGAKKLLSKMPYNSKAILQKSIDRLYESEGLHLWLKEGYDLVLDAKTFFIKLSLALGYEEKIINNAIEQAINLQNEIDRFKDSYIFVDTKFKRTTEPVLVLSALESSRRISLFNVNKLLFKDEREILNIVANMVKEHYDYHLGELSTWGKIDAYQLNLFDKIYIFNTKGELLKDKESSPESIAVMKLKNK